ncbi:hypothetical protein GCM10011409_21790 [Lentibacillus populi]|uniref:Uncharacterized protein n=1 Tax=Lentibacillus populi TaxID=1827502 RepID=A0A9W5TXM5_9BACI|nr:hypothetical protein GCM10011409_21790 [Lentibacillus populi]
MDSCVVGDEYANYRVKSFFGITGDKHFILFPGEASNIRSNHLWHYNGLDNRYYPASVHLL